MSKKQENLTHEEVWDDSALIDSWNEALQEYKKYHSIHAKGGSVRDIEPRDDVEMEAETESEQPQVAETEESGLTLEKAEENKIPPARNEAKEPTPSLSQGVPAFPIQTVLGSVQDESLKKLLMSWYYAGYYTGLYEGQQQAQQNHAS
ncbi:survival motor neuron 1 [Fusarium longipes]|uniref:Survival motor neuron 1 n=1 Tax=Fusarium longipes TaxID=694270 RepID=A0A395SUA3_9HYPO|nr:survival motor neuron 1 [Fusarium longipes]